MNRSRQEFSSRGNKGFNSNGKGWKQQNLKSGSEKKKLSSGGAIPDGKNRPKSGDKLQQNGFEEERKLKKVPGGFGKKEVPLVNGNHKVASGKKHKSVIQPVVKPKEITQKSPKLVNGNAPQGKSKKEQKSTPDTGQKRKSLETNSGGSSKKLKKAKKEVPSESDSDAEDYMDKFFEDCLDDDEAEEEPPLTPSGEESESELSESETESDGDDEDDGNAMSFEELMDFYGNHKDRNGSVAKKAKKTEKKVGARKASDSSFTNGGWIEEDNDVELEYKDSDGEQEQASAGDQIECQALVPAAVAERRDELETSEDDYDYEPGDSGEEEIEEEEDIDEMLSFELGQDFSDDDDESLEEEDEDDSFGSDYSDASSNSKDDHEFSSDFDSDEDEYGSEEEDEEDGYWDDTGSYDSGEDTDYVPLDDDDLYIGRGEAVIYEIDDNSVSFNDAIESAQIVELPTSGGGTTTGTESQTEGEGEGEGGDEEDIPELVPIYDARGRMIDSAEKLERELRKSKKSPKQSPANIPQPEPEPPTPVVPPPTATPMESDSTADDASSSFTARNLHDLTDDADPSMDTAEPELPTVILPPAKRSAYRLYDSLDMRMSLAILKDTLYFSGHLTIQPLIGQLEVMGYRLKRGECRNVFAARGFQSLNLTPVADGAGFTKELMAGVLTRLDRHFQEVDLRELEERFDPEEMVLVLLQADCNSRRIAVVERYLPEEVLFPRVELLRKGVFFTSEHLLNCEFFVEHPQQDKGATALFRSDPAWDRIEVKANSRVVVMGGKGAGKSTLCQYLVNRNVGAFKKVLLIDLDIGQPIQHIPETISVTVVNKPLLGVASFDPIAPVKSWLFGSLDVVSSPIFYIQNVRALIQFCRDHKADYGNIPWIINTMGYVTGFGEELMAAVLRMLSPTDVIQLSATTPTLAIPNFKNSLNAEFVNRYSFNILQAEVAQYCQKKTFFRHHALPVSYSRKGFTLNAPKRRHVALLTHLARILNDSSSEWFNEVQPFRAPLAQLQVLITREDQSLPEDALPAVLNATLVYLCRKSAHQLGLYECLGIGIVRGVDKQGNVYLLHSLPGEELAEVTVLAICSSSLPNAAFLRQSARVQGAIPYVYNVE